MPKRESVVCTVHTYNIKDSTSDETLATGSFVDVGLEVSA